MRVDGRPTKPVSLVGDAPNIVIDSLKIKDNGSETPESYPHRIGDGHDGMVFFGMKDEGQYAADHSDRGLPCVNHEYVVTLRASPGRPHRRCRPRGQ